MERFADLSEHQPTFDADAYLRSGCTIIIVRVHSGYRKDNAMPGRMVQVRSKPFQAVGYYQYLTKDRQAETQAQEFCSLVGHLKPNEFPILDLEEGSGNQTGRAEAWFSIVDPWASFPATLYTGASMLQTQLSGAAHWHRPRWIASYPNSYSPDMGRFPAGATFWQYTDRGKFAGCPGGVDGSVYPGTAAEFRTEVCGKGSAPGQPAGTGEVATARMVDGRQEVFLYEAGTVWHKWQKPDRSWGSWQVLGVPGG